MDPESGEPASPSPVNGDVRANPGMVKALIRALVTRLHAILEVLAPKKNVGVENRFYYDEVEKVWKLQGGETEQERAEAEAIRFHTSRGLSSALAPATTACDPSRGLGGNGVSIDDVPPPPMGGPITHSLHRPSAGYGFSMASLAHPVYAPHGFGVGDKDGSGAGNRDSAPPRSRSGPCVAPPAVRTLPFGGARAVVPLSSPSGAAAPLMFPFGVPPGTAAAAAPLTSPFGVPAGAPVAAASLASPFGAPLAGSCATAAHGPLASPFGVVPENAGLRAAAALKVSFPAGAAPVSAPPTAPAGVPVEACVAAPPVVAPHPPLGGPGVATALATPFHAQT